MSNFGSNRCNDMISSFHCRLSNGRLFLSTPAKRIGTKKDDISRGWRLSSTLPAQSTSAKARGDVDSCQKQPIINSTFKISSYLFFLQQSKEGRMVYACPCPEKAYDRKRLLVVWQDSIPKKIMKRNPLRRIDVQVSLQN